MTAKQLKKWEHFAEIEPFTFNPELRADFRAASIVQVIANVNRGKGKSAYKLDEFRLKFDEETKPKREKTWQEMQKIILNMIVPAYNAEGVTV